MTWQEHPDCPSKGTFLCQVSDVPDGGGMEVVIGAGKEPFKILLLRKGKKVYSYLNSCPHFSLPLNYHPQKFIVSGGQLVCAHHTAFFEFESGYCTEGPCNGSSLIVLPSYCLEKQIYFGSYEEAL